MCYKTLMFLTDEPERIFDELKNALKCHVGYELVTLQVLEHQHLTIVILRDPFAWKAYALTAIEDKQFKEGLGW